MLLSTMMPCPSLLPHCTPPAANQADASSHRCLLTWAASPGGMPYLYPSDVLTEYSTGITAAPGPRLSVCRQRARSAFRAASVTRLARRTAGRKCRPIEFTIAFRHSEQVLAPDACTSVRSAGLRRPRSVGTSSSVVVAQITTRAGVAGGRGRNLPVAVCRGHTMHTFLAARRTPEGVSGTRVANV